MSVEPGLENDILDSLKAHGQRIKIWAASHGRQGTQSFKTVQWVIRININYCINFIITEALLFEDKLQAILKESLELKVGLLEALLRQTLSLENRVSLQRHLSQ